MKPQNKLKEIIWEITGKCNNGCDYCGSKECWDESIDEGKISEITMAICEYLKNGEINISGGDPLLVSIGTHNFITSEFRTSGNKVKIIGTFYVKLKKN